MFCKTCGKQLNDKAKFCSGCGNAVQQKVNSASNHIVNNNIPVMNKIKNLSTPVIISIIIGIVLVIIFFAVVFSEEGLSGYASNVFDVDLATLLNEISNNNARANQEYHNVTLRLSGVATNIDNNSLWLAVSTSRAYDSILVFFNQSEYARIINLSYGQRITIIGVYDGSSFVSCIRYATIE